MQKSTQLLHQARNVFNGKKRSVGDRDEADIFFNVKRLKRDDSKDFLEDKMVAPRCVSTCDATKRLLTAQSDRARMYFQPSQDLLLREINEVATRMTKDHGALKVSVTVQNYTNLY
jgi:hypothetical protein